MRSCSPSSLASRFRFIDELIEAGEPGRDNVATPTPLTWGEATAGEAIVVGGVQMGCDCDGSSRAGGMMVGVAPDTDLALSFLSRREREDAAAAAVLQFLGSTPKNP